ncbi:hypothetical protein NECAME_16674 [Necator americanus]|uniref:Peptidase A1 domain-containing protein n=1 Tax=Necator americanus TaxID=51031 RepID=W2TXF4_NECAM|nr:hypothetical protein NECAME_16674 [Necator americanus]ETN85717.1 hypothetical protein NECAME_16674 [Necator americanus]
MCVIDGAYTHPICNGYPISGRTKKKFCHGNSKTLKHTRKRFTLTYVSAWAAGFIGTDNIAYGSPMDGIFGLGFNEVRDVAGGIFSVPSAQYVLDLNLGKRSNYTCVDYY